MRSMLVLLERQMLRLEQRMLQVKMIFHGDV